MLGLRRFRRERIVLEAHEIGVSGERHHASAIQQLLAERADGVLEYHGACTIRRDRDNSADPHAVEVLVHGARVGFISRRWSATVAAKIDDHEIEMKCVVNWNGETQNGIYHVKLLPVF